MTNSILDKTVEIPRKDLGKAPLPKEVAEAFQLLLETSEPKRPWSSTDTLLVLADDLARARALEFGAKIDAATRVTARESVNLEVTESFRMLRSQNRGWLGGLWVCAGPEPTLPFPVDATLRIYQEVDRAGARWHMQLEQAAQPATPPISAAITGLAIESALGTDFSVHRREFIGAGSLAAADAAPATTSWVGASQLTSGAQVPENLSEKWGRLASVALQQAKIEPGARIIVLGAGQYSSNGQEPAANHGFGVPSHIPITLGGQTPLSRPVQVLSHACASVLYAAELATRILTDQQVTAVVVVAASTPSVAAESSMRAVRALTDAAARPFSEDRSGITLGAGAGAIVLQDPQRLSVPELARLHTAASSVAAPTPSSQSASDVAAVLGRVFDGFPYPDVVIAHATGTPVGDPVELDALADQFQNAPEAIPVTSHKGATGHLLHASGMLGIAHAISLLGQRRVHGSWGLTQETGSGMARCLAGSQGAHSVQLMNQEARSVAVNALGFGGNTASLLLGAASPSA